jgi:hypothetical protein
MFCGGKKKDGRRLLFYRQKYNPKKPNAKIVTQITPARVLVAFFQQGAEK